MGFGGKKKKTKKKKVAKKPCQKDGKVLKKATLPKGGFAYWQGTLGEAEGL